MLMLRKRIEFAMTKEEGVRVRVTFTPFLLLSEFRKKHVKG
jgi:hypothetical protein